jgi:hypothetical protein
VALRARTGNAGRPSRLLPGRMRRGPSSVS